MTLKTAIVGMPLAHSLSPILHNLAYKKLGIDAEMLSFESKDIQTVIDFINEQEIALTAVTMPHKEKILPFLDEVDEVAHDMGAINTVINKKGRLYGYNTDIIGIAHALRNLNFTNKQVLILGAGGAARALAYYLSKSKGNLLYINRNRKRAKLLAESYGGRVITPEEIPNDVYLIANATPLGMHPYENESPLEAKWMPSYCIVFDMIYNPSKTKLMQSVKHSISGLDMFVGQGLEQIRLWTGKKLDSGDFIHLLKNAKY